MQFERINLEYRTKEVYRDLYLHPKDEGFAFYTKALSKEIEKYF